MLNEIVKSFLPEPKTQNYSSDVDQKNVIKDLEDDVFPVTGSFFDNNTGIFGNSEKSDLLKKQKEKINKYRAISIQPEVSDALDEIVNEVIFSQDMDLPIKIEVNQENEKLKEKIQEEFDKIIGMLNLDRNFYSIVRQSYIDGQLIVHCSYDQKNTKGGIQKLQIIEPVDFYYDKKKEVFKYDKKNTLYSEETTQEYSLEEIVRDDFGIHSEGLNLSYLEYAIKNANILKTMEDLLIPLRFSRSISRRVFNVDIGDLPTKRGNEVMNDYKREFKYKKFYNAETGEVSNQQHITSMVEDYWFSNRSGGKGTEVSLLDESGNLGELDDILYFYKKLYRSMKIPTNRIPFAEDAGEFDYNDSRTTKEDIKFFMHTSRVRKVYSSVIKKILKRQVIATGIMKKEEWDNLEDDINVYFSNENMFVEQMRLENFTKKLDIYATVQEYQGKLFSVDTILKDVFKYSDEEIEEEFKKIAKEEKDPKFAKFYQVEEE